MTKIRFQKIVAIAACLAVAIFASCKKDTPDLNGSVTVSPAANVFTGDELTAAYSGSETVTWQWNKNGTAINGATAAKYVTDEYGSYTVTATATGYNDKTSAPIEVKPVTLLLKRETSDGWRAEYEYDKQNRITKRNIYSIANGQLRNVETLKYNSTNGDLEELERKFLDDPTQNHKITFTKNGNKITAYTNNGIVFYEFELNPQGLPAKYTANEINTVYTWQNGNLTKKETDISGIGSVENYTYDDKKSPFYHCKTPRWYLLQYEGWYLHSVNNFINFSGYWTNDENTLYNSIYEYDYLNVEGFPVSRKLFVGGLGFVLEESFSYVKK